MTPFVHRFGPRCVLEGPYATLACPVADLGAATGGWRGVCARSDGEQEADERIRVTCAWEASSRAGRPATSLRRRATARSAEHRVRQKIRVIGAWSARARW